MEIPKPLSFQNDEERIVANQTVRNNANLKNQGSQSSSQALNNKKAPTITNPGLNNQAFTCDIHTHGTDSKSTGLCSSKDRESLDTPEEGENVDLINNAFRDKTKCRFYCCDSCNQQHEGNTPPGCEKCEKCQRCEQQRSEQVLV